MTWILTTTQYAVFDRYVHVQVISYYTTQQVYLRQPSVLDEIFSFHETNPEFHV